MNITPTDEQAKGIKKIVSWYRDKNARQYAVVQGLAGTGKSTIIGCTVDELGLPREKVLYGAFSAKAASILRSKGHEANTLHSLIYKPVEPDEEALEAKREVIDVMKQQLHTLPETMRAVQQQKIRQIEFEMREMHRPRFVLNSESPLRDAPLLIVDEYSMMNKRMFHDLLSFGVRIILVGDHGQLHPPKGECAVDEDDYDVRLETIMRQAGDSPIIRLAHMARNGYDIPFGKFSDEVVKLRRNQVPPEVMLRAEQTIVGYNATRFMLNAAMKRALGGDGVMPVSGERTICLKNDHDHGLWNGCLVQMDDVRLKDDMEFSAVLTTDSGVRIGRKRIYMGHYLDHRSVDKDRHIRDWKAKKKLIELCPAFALSAFKAQGSEYSNVCFVDDGFGRSVDDRRRFMYVGISRAKSGLMLLA